MSAAVLTLVIISVCAFGSISCHNDQVFQTLLSTLERLVNFYKSAYQGMNLDGIFGLRTLEGQLGLVLGDIASRKIHGVDQKAINRLQRLHEVASEVSNMSLTYLKDSEPEYYERMKPLVDKPFKFAKPYRQIKPRMRWKQSDLKSADAGFNEEFSDDCMAELMGSDGHTKCGISQTCLNTMIEPGHGGYHITHQLLYTILAEISGCLPVLNYLLKESGHPGIESLQDELCTNNFLEVAQIVQDLKGNLIPRVQDLFMEQEMVCPLLGFMEFLHSDWLKQMMAWQKPNGCYGKMMKSDLAKFSNSHYEYDGQNSDKEEDELADEIKFRDYERNKAPSREQNKLDMGGIHQAHRKLSDAGKNMIVSNIQRNVNSVKVEDQQNVIVQQPNGNLHAIERNSTAYKSQPQVNFQPRANAKPANAVIVNNKNFQLVNNQLNVKQNTGDSVARAAANGKPRQANQIKPNVQNVQSIGKQSQQQTIARVNNDQRRTPVVHSNKNVRGPRTDGSPREMGTNGQGGIGQVGVSRPGQAKRGLGGNPQDNQGWWEGRRQTMERLGGKGDNPVNNRGLTKGRGDAVKRAVYERTTARPKIERVAGLLPGQPNIGQAVVGQGRRLLFERDLQDGCLSHKTAVAAGALSQYLRFILDPGPPEYQALVQLAGTNFLMAANHAFAPEETHVRPPEAAAVERHFQENNVLRRPNIPDDIHIVDKRGGDFVVDGGDSEEIEPIKEEVNPLDSRDNGMDLDDHNHQAEEEYADHQENPPQDYYKDQINFNNQEEDLLNKKMQSETEKRGKSFGEKDKADYADDEYKEDEDKDKDEEERKELHEAGLDAGDKEYEQYIDNDENGFNNINKGDNGDGDDYEDEDEDEDTDQEVFPNKVKMTASTRLPMIDVIKTENEIKQIMKEDAYNYYDNGARPFQKGTGHLLGEASDQVNLGQVHKFELSNSLGKTYLFLLFAMLILLFFMYRFIRRRRVLIRYRYR